MAEEKPAARVTDMHTCPASDGPIPHVGGPVIMGSANVFIGGLPAARFGDAVTCLGPTDTIAMGSQTVLINGMPAARMGDQTSHGGVIVGGLPSVLIGTAPGATGAGGDGEAGRQVDAAAAKARLNAIAKAVNPSNGQDNCGNIIDAVVARLRGTNPNAVAKNTLDGTFPQIETRFKTKFRKIGSLADAYQHLQKAGPGSIGLIGIIYPGGSGSHVVTIANVGGTVGIVEGQNWSASEPAEAITNSAAAVSRYDPNGNDILVLAILPKSA
ncbi:PAAR domain-containing protein [Acidiphilium acidophilum]|nr:PAAR domain-containing protein [Acidiphilium acidophilum]